MALTKVPTNLIQTRTVTTSTGATITPTSDTADTYEVTALDTASTIAAPSGTPQNNQRLLFKIRDNGTARALTWDAIYRAVEVTLPATTTVNKTLYVGCIYNSVDSKWDVLAIGQT
jgi:hypothetical protein